MRNKHLLKRAKELRRGMAEAEKLLWKHLRGKQLGVKFRRQEVIGNYIVDFVCYAKRLVIEVDGGQHLESEYDQQRDKEPKRLGFKVLRFWNNEVLRDLEGVLGKIWEEVNSSSSPSPYPPPARGGG